MVISVFTLIKRISHAFNMKKVNNIISIDFNIRGKTICVLLIFIMPIIQIIN